MTAFDIASHTRANLDSKEIYLAMDIKDTINKAGSQRLKGTSGRINISRSCLGNAQHDCNVARLTVYS
jgi:hypothetical protein